MAGPRDAETRFGDFAEEWLEAVAPRLELNTIAKYRSFLDNQLLPQWNAWPLIANFNGYVEIERWLSELHEDYAESSVSSYFALRNGVRVSMGEFDTERLVATPAQALRAAMRLYEMGLGKSGVRAVSDGCLYRRPLGSTRGPAAARVRLRAPWHRDPDAAEGGGG
ncbi:N-terminal phage integrase SAM-like domain-containing protein [Amycolatopsis rifamycinica]|uniref:Integrase SAM-like N-terminal domain-containing protein n=1 Tax=Amycolatopsis rifamycinica TaxID=287986 RepID=A0A066TUB6_9PSEU|nr:N-terminal phage integrase SAM-like domain-containing protein [Amycolatopsis rifamycinica]KDN17137.1 hypothetical protein DV20_37740 [Amycolatopsis rifamycinica]